MVNTHIAVEIQAFSPHSICSYLNEILCFISFFVLDAFLVELEISQEGENVSFPPFVILDDVRQKA